MKPYTPDWSDIVRMRKREIGELLEEVDKMLEEMTCPAGGRTCGHDETARRKTA